MEIKQDNNGKYGALLAKKNVLTFSTGETQHGKTKIPYIICKYLYTQ